MAGAGGRATAPTAEQQRLDEARQQGMPWRPYRSERQWGTVREHCSESGDAWNRFSHDQARSRAYHWGEDGLAGFSDEHQRLCFALAACNDRAPILKLIATGIFDHGSEAATLHVLSKLSLRNGWTSWRGPPRPSLRDATGDVGAAMIHATHAELGELLLHCEDAPELLLAENAPDIERIFGTRNTAPQGQGRGQCLRRPGAAGCGQSDPMRDQGRRAMPARGRRRPVGRAPPSAARPGSRSARWSGSCRSAPPR
jgi:hypothetical protein